MKQQITELVSQAIKRLESEGFLSTENTPPIIIEHARDKQHGDFACNIALQLAKITKLNPRELATKIISVIPQSEIIDKIDIAGPGFINFFLKDSSFNNIIQQILSNKDQFGRLEIGKDKRVHIEILSANPTGPLHVGHGRLAAYGATVANLLEAIGYHVHREYYVNDAGRQMQILAVSIWLRYLELCGGEFKFPSNGYKGDYIIDIAKQLYHQHKEKFIVPIDDIFDDLPEDFKESTQTGNKEAHIDGIIKNAKALLSKEDFDLIFHCGLESILTDISDDLAEFGVNYQEWFNESQLVENGDMDRGIARLRDNHQLYEKDGATWFKATEFGDEKDRVVIRENGNPTYFAADISYHFNKFDRGFDLIINVFGADHHGYEPRIYAFLKAAKEDINRLKFLFVQFAILFRGQERISMSTRAGSFITLRELRQEVGNDAARYFYIMRRREQHLDFDLELAKSRSSENPVYYIQYAHARICNVFVQLKHKKMDWDQLLGLQHVNLLNTEHEQALLKSLTRYPEIIQAAGVNFEPHILAHYLQELANDFHTYYNAHQFLVEDEKLRNARLNLIVATKTVLANGLELLGVSRPEQM